MIGQKSEQLTLILTIVGAWHDKFLILIPVV